MYTSRSFSPKRTAAVSIRVISRRIPFLSLRILSLSDLFCYLMRNSFFLAAMCFVISETSIPTLYSAFLYAFSASKMRRSSRDGMNGTTAKFAMIGCVFLELAAKDEGDLYLAIGRFKSPVRVGTGVGWGMGTAKEWICPVDAPAWAGGLGEGSAPCLT